MRLDNKIYFKWCVNMACCKGKEDMIITQSGREEGKERHKQTTRQTDREQVLNFFTLSIHCQLAVSIIFKGL